MHKCMCFGVFAFFCHSNPPPIEFLNFQQFQQISTLLFYFIFLAKPIAKLFCAGTSVIGDNTYLLVMLISCEQQFF
jgi:hypothetical protein